VPEQFARARLVRAAAVAARLVRLDRLFELLLRGEHVARAISVWPGSVQPEAAATAMTSGKTEASGRMKTSVFYHALW